MHVTILVRLTDNMQTCTPAQNEIKEICFWLENKFTNSFTLKGRFWLHCRSAGWEQVVSGNGDAMFTSAMSQIIQSNRSSTGIVFRWWWLHKVDSSLQRSCLQDTWRRWLLARQFPQYCWTHASGMRGELNFMDVLFIKPSLNLFVIGKTGGDEELPVGWCVRIKDIHIKKCTVVRSSPETLGLNVCSSIVLSDCRCTSHCDPPGVGGLDPRWYSDKRLCVMSRISL